MVEDLEEEWKADEKKGLLQGWGFSREEFLTLKVRIYVAFDLLPFLTYYFQIFICFQDSLRLVKQEFDASIPIPFNTRELVGYVLDRLVEDPSEWYIFPGQVTLGPDPDEEVGGHKASDAGADEDGEGDDDSEEEVKEVPRPKPNKGKGPATRASPISHSFPFY